MEKQVLYCVMRLNETIDVSVNGNMFTLVLGDMKGFIPVYNTLEEANNHSNDGKYQVVPVTI